MNTAIELHDSEVSAVTFDGDSAVVSLSPAYLHHASSGWLQPATLTFRGISPTTAPTDLPAWVSDGFLRLGGTLHDNLLPVSVVFDGPVEFSIVLVTAQTLSIQAQHVSVELLGEPSYVELSPWSTVA